MDLDVTTTPQTVSSLYQPVTTQVHTFSSIKCHIITVVMVTKDPRLKIVKGLAFIPTSAGYLNIKRRLRPSLYPALSTESKSPIHLYCPA